MRLIIDTDTAGDDAFSILLALRTPGVSVEAVTICNGNVDFDQQVENALVTLEVAGRGGEVPVYAGCRRPLQREPFSVAHVFGEDGMSNAGFGRAKQRPEARHAVDAIVDLVMANPGEITILAQAPLTNIAAAYAKEPRIARAVRHLWVMGGTDNGIGNVTPAAEFNFYVDPEAARTVFRAGFSVTLSTWTLTVRSGLLSEATLARIESLDTPLSRFFMQVNRATFDFMRSHHGVAVSTHPDSLTCAMMLDEGLIIDADVAQVDVETTGDLTRGYCSVATGEFLNQSHLGPGAPPLVPNARIVKAADTAGFERMLLRALG